MFESRRYRKYLAIAALVILASCWVGVRASRMERVSDRLSRSWPGATSSHEIKFTVQQAIPANGRIIIRPEAGYFSIPAAMDNTDISLAVATDPEGLYIERPLGVFWGDVVQGKSGRVNIILDAPINAGDAVKVKLGTRGPDGNFLANPDLVGAYHVYVETRSDTNVVMDRADAAVAIVNPVSVTNNVARLRSNGQPTGVLLAGTKETLLSLATNYSATCKFSTASDTPYALMTRTFMTADNRYHSVVVDGLIDGSYFFYYVRCRDVATSEADLDDYVIVFSVERSGGAGGTGGGTGGGSGTGEGSGSGTGSSGGTSGGSSGSGSSGSGGGGSGSGGGTGSGQGSQQSGGGGGGSGGGTGASMGGGTDGGAATAGATQVGGKQFPTEPSKPSLSLAGWSAVGGEVVLLKDGKQVMKSTADGAAKFNLSVNDLVEGVYTFSMYSVDTEARKSANYAATFAVRQNSKTELTKIIIPPTFSVAKAELAAGEAAAASGQSVPGATIELWLVQSTSGGTTSKKQVSVGSNGKWSASLDTKGLPNGQYNFKARTFLKDIGYSDFSLAVPVGLGVKLGSVGACQGADLNRDGKVNLIDFSILLYHWGTSNACADQNHDGKVNLTDFSIMLYNWTG